MTDTALMTREEMLDYFRRVLDAQLQALLATAQETVCGLIDPLDRQSDPLDRAIIENDRGMTLRFRSRESRLIRKIRDALERIADGTYGNCQRCGDEIGVARLMARPVASYCISCKSEMEAAEKAVGF